MGLLIPYDFGGHDHHFEPDFVVRLTDGRMLLVEVKGCEDDQERAKYAGARRWCSAVNHHGQLGAWRFHPCRDPQLVGQELAALAVFGVVLIPAGMLTFAWCERWAKKTGRLKRQG